VNIYLLILSSKIKCISKLELSTLAQCRQDPAGERSLGPIVTGIRSGDDVTIGRLKLRVKIGRENELRRKKSHDDKVMWAPPYVENTK
jgi:hypothetical protein